MEEIFSVRDVQCFGRKKVEAGQAGAENRFTNALETSVHPIVLISRSGESQVSCPHNTDGKSCMAAEPDPEKNYPPCAYVRPEPEDMFSDLRRIIQRILGTKIF